MSSTLGLTSEGVLGMGKGMLLAEDSDIAGHEISFGVQPLLVKLDRESGQGLLGISYVQILIYSFECALERHRPPL